MVNPCQVPPLPARLYSALMHRIPLSSGLTRLGFNRLTNRLFVRCEDPIEAVMLSGVRIEVDPNDYHGRVLYLFGTNDPKVQATAKGLLRRGDRFLDIGANYSSIGIQMASVVGPEGQIHLFEPQPELRRRVQAAIDQSSLVNVRLHGVGLMDRDDEMVLSIPPNHSGMATLVAYSDQDHWQKQTIQVRDVATYLPPLVDGLPFGVKIDVEGAEIYLLPWLLRQPNLRFLIVEAAHNQQELWDMVEASGMTLYGLRRIVFKKEVQRVAVYEQMSLYHDLVAVRLRADVPKPVVTTPHGLSLAME